MADAPGKKQAGTPLAAQGRLVGYEAPAIVESADFETLALSCAKVDGSSYPTPCNNPVTQTFS